jgi:hypothetical protein
VVPFAAVLLLMMACRDASGPDRTVGPPLLQECQPENGSCGGGGGGDGGITDPNPSAPGYFGGTLYAPAACFSATGAGINDADYDGMSDFCEQRLAALFAPAFATAPASYDCDRGMEPYWSAKYFPARGNVVRIAYLFSYYRDCGSSGTILSALGSFIGTVFTFNGLFPDYSLGPIPISSADQTESHSGDSEFLIVDLRWDAASMHWYLSRAFLSAHFGTAADGSRSVSTSGISYPTKYGGYPLVWVAANKHANYPSRSTCNAGRGPLGTIHDNCDSNSPIYGSRMYFSGYRNVGSAQQSLIGAQGCVTSQNQPLFKPGTECFWKPGDYFDGWLQYPYGTRATPYYSLLIAKFECYSYSLVAPGRLACLDWGVNNEP